MSTLTDEIPPPPGRVVFPVKKTTALYEFLHKRNVDLGLVTIDSILTLLHTYIFQQRLWDPTNPFIILCNLYLENIFGMKMLHFCQMTEALCKISLSQGVVFKIRYIPYPDDTHAPQPYKLFNQSSNLQRFLIGEGMHPTFGRSYTFVYIRSLIVKYLIKKRYYIFDSRNIHVAQVKKNISISFYKMNNDHNSGS